MAVERDVLDLVGIARLEILERETADHGERVFEDRASPRSARESAHAPVGLFAASPLGLHDIMGNVNEWAHVFQVESPTFRPRPQGRWKAEERYAIRGDSFATQALNSRPGLYGLATPDFGGPSIGVRPMQRLDPE